MTQLKIWILSYNNLSPFEMLTDMLTSFGFDAPTFISTNKKHIIIDIKKNGNNLTQPEMDSIEEKAEKIMLVKWS